MRMAYPRHTKLEALRKRRGWKRSVLAERVGISYQHIYGIERGFNAPADETLQLIANELGVELSEIEEVPVDRSDQASGAASTGAAPTSDEAAVAGAAEASAEEVNAA